MRYVERTIQGNRLPLKNAVSRADIFRGIDMSHWALLEEDNAKYLSGDAVNKLAEYEELEEQGRLVKLPCKAGDDIYAILFGLGDDPILKLGVEYVVIRSSLRGISIGVYFSDPQQPMCQHYGILGKDVFLTRKEAEAMLKSLEKESKNES